MKRSKQLRIYTASAGSGKTHTLTGEYLRLALRTRGAFRYIQAVTFTNKATAEMKERILEELYSLAMGGSSPFTETMMQELALTSEQLQIRAQEVLTEILNDYSSLRVKTIDSFFQEVMRAFSHELGLPGGFRIEMEQKTVLEQAVVRLLHSLGEKDTSDVENWIRRLAEELIEEGRGHNIRREMISLGDELFKEQLLLLSEEGKLPTKAAIHRYQTEMNKLVEAFQERRLSIARRAEEIVSAAGISFYDFKGGILEFAKVLKGAEVKPPTKTFMAMAEGDPETTLYAKSTSATTQAAILSAYHSGLKECLTEMAGLYLGREWQEYSTAKQSLPFLNRLGIISDLWRQIEEIRQEENKMLISDAPSLLHRIIDGSETPFVYDKIGIRIEHEMIDEFQDTSRLQYENFKPLLAESLAHGKYNLLVGDAKQSIYRFRNADRRLLTDVVSRDFAETSERVNLPYNWRSAPEIIAFNNTLYEHLPQILCEAMSREAETVAVPDPQLGEEIKRTFMHTYADVEQLVPPARADGHGAVCVYAPPAESQDSADAELSWEERILQDLPRFIIGLQKRGYAPSDIAILVRKTYQAREIARAMLSYQPEKDEVNYPLIPMSDESLSLSGAASIRFFSNLLKFISRPQSDALRQIAYLSYEELRKEKGLNPMEEGNFSATELAEFANLRRRSLYELAEGLVSLFHTYLLEDETPYVVAWLDLINDFGHERSADLHSFLQWWEETGYAKSRISSAPNSQAVTLMTIHKAKGLGFRVVLIPFLDWSLDDEAAHRHILWCKIDTNRTPFNILPVVPIRYKKEMAQTMFATDYFRERADILLDNLNLLYVATTRAKDEMHLWLPPSKKPESLSTVGDLMHLALASLEENKGESDVYCWGDPHLTVRQKAKDRPSSGLSFALPKGRPSAISERLAIRPEGSEFYRRHKPLYHGHVMHRILADIILAQDIAPAIENYVSAGIVTDEEAVELSGRLSVITSDIRFSHWFDGSGRVLNEQDILLPEGGQRRPDRIILYEDHTDIVDYKFGRIRETHHAQMKSYIHLLNSMGYPSVRGYLWSLPNNEVVSVGGV
ncbi:exodeoxyribonuclease V subunit beta [Porphyromonas gulae]|uniref:UvrD-helicase domain-containing protein n=1 Tax=Porphyromonas gulae TaxID=111105 RepID=UPI0026E9EB3C|nr:UvrD-helicase domain-containing protein [Porphyromonas gulae]